VISISKKVIIKVFIYHHLEIEKYVYALQYFIEIAIKNFDDTQET